VSEHLDPARNRHRQYIVTRHHRPNLTDRSDSAINSAAERWVRGRLQCSKRRADWTSDQEVLCVKFCKGGHGWLESCGLAELDFLVLFEIVHIEIAVGFEPVLVGFDG
jgi:hypothetical protein